jgi:hypothetical protein
MKAIHVNSCSHPSTAYAGTAMYRDQWMADYYFWSDTNHYTSSRQDNWRVCVRLSSEDGNYMSGGISMYYGDKDVMSMFIPFITKEDD